MPGDLTQILSRGVCRLRIQPGFTVGHQPQPSRRYAAELLLDTHAVLWWLAEPDRLSPAVHGAIADPGNRVQVSAASGWEIATKVRPGKRPAVSDLLNDLPRLLAAQAVGCPVCWLPRLLAAQAVGCSGV